MLRRYVSIALGLFMLCRALTVSAAPVTHPNLLLNKAEIEQVKAKIQKYEWAAALFEKVKELARDGSNIREVAICYALTGDKVYGDRARNQLLQQARYDLGNFAKLDLKLTPESYAWTSWSTYAWAYDLTYDTFTPEERKQIEDWLRAGSKVLIDGDKLWTTTPNLIFGKHFNVGMVGYCLGDQELIDWGLKDPGAFGPHRGGMFPVLDTMINDGYFWSEAPIYALHYDIHGMLALAEAARHYDGTDLYSYASKKSGASIKSLIDGFLRMGFPLERTGLGGGSVRMATYGDGSTGYNPDGTMAETFLTDSLYFGCLELAYKRYQDPGYAWMLSLNPARDANITYGRAVWGLVGLTHGEPLPANPTPPPAPSGVYPNQGFAMLRADESPKYWTSGALAAMVMLGKAVGHGHNDYFSLVLHGKGRLLYPDLNVIQYEPTYLNWTHEGIGHSTLLVDRESPHAGPFTTQQDFNNDVKYFAIAGSMYKQVDQTRRLLLTKEYLVDVFHAADQQGDTRTFDWVLHGLGRLYPGNPAAYRPTDALVPYYWWVDNERGRTTGSTWQADWVQRTAGVTPGRQFGKEWFDRQVGTRMTMLGVPDTQVYYGDGPITHAPPFGRMDGNPEPAAPLVVARRHGSSATFATVHEPYEGMPAIRSFRRLAEDGNAIAMTVETPDYTDILCVAFDDKPHVLTAGNEVISFSEYGYLRMTANGITARGKITAFRLATDEKKPRTVVLNGKRVSVSTSEGQVHYGTLPKDQTAVPPMPSSETKIEQAAALHYWFLPEEVHLSALMETDERKVEMHLRCTGAGETAGRMKVIAPVGIQVEPREIDIAPQHDGQEQVIPLTVRKTAGAKSDLYTIALVPDDKLNAPRGTLLASVGVNITLDRRIPMSTQYVVRAPGYTMKVDNYSGVSYYLLDSEGHRRFGRFTGNFIYGFPGIEGVAQYRMPGQFVWIGESIDPVKTVPTPGDHSFTVGFNGARIHYQFEEDRMVFSLIQPTDPGKTFKMWLGNFDVLGTPVHTGKQEQPWLPIVADWVYFPHPVYREGVLLQMPPKTPLENHGIAVALPFKFGDEVTMKFATPEEVEALKNNAK